MHVQRIDELFLHLKKLSSIIYSFSQDARSVCFVVTCELAPNGLEGTIAHPTRNVDLSRSCNLPRQTLKNLIRVFLQDLERFLQESYKILQESQDM